MSGSGRRADVGSAREQLIGGRYALHNVIAAGGMATVHFGRLVGSVGFRRTVAIKRLHPHLASESELVAMLLDEARLAARIHHPNVVGTLDFVEENQQLFLILEYVAGLSVSALMSVAKPPDRLTPPQAVAILVGTLHGLHAAHEALSATGEPLAIVHRDVSPQNILVGEDGIARVIDFGVAKAVERIHATKGNDISGKIAYMAPEQLTRAQVDRRTDIYAASIVLWELLTHKRYIDAPDASPAARINLALARQPEPPSRYASNVPPVLDELVMRGLSHDPDQRFSTALEMAVALDNAVAAASQREIGEWVSRVGGQRLRARAAELRRIESEDHEADPRGVTSRASGVRAANTPKSAPPPAPKSAPPPTPKSAPPPAVLFARPTDDAPRLRDLVKNIDSPHVEPLSPTSAISVSHMAQLPAAPALALPDPPTLEPERERDREREREPEEAPEPFLSTTVVHDEPYEPTPLAASSTARHASPHKKRELVWFVSAIGGIGLLAAFVSLSSPPASAPPVVVTTNTTSSPPPEAPVPPFTAAPTASTAPAPSPSTATSAHLAAPTTSKPRAHVTSAPRKPRSASCDPPYTIDHGIQVPKPECL